jgi:hypothetical protein
MLGDKDKKLDELQINAARPEDKEDEKWIVALPLDLQLLAHDLMDHHWNVNDPDFIKNMKSDKGSGYVEVLKMKAKGNINDPVISNFINNFNDKADENRTPKIQKDPTGRQIMILDSDHPDYNNISKIKYNAPKEGVKTNEHGIQKTIIRDAPVDPKHLKAVIVKPDLDNKTINEQGQIVFRDPKGVDYQAVYHDGSTKSLNEADYQKLSSFNKMSAIDKEKFNQEFVKHQLNTQNEA